MECIGGEGRAVRRTVSRVRRGSYPPQETILPPAPRLLVGRQRLLEIRFGEEHIAGVLQLLDLRRVRLRKGRG